MGRKCDHGEGMAVKTLSRQSSVEWWMATPDRTIKRVEEWPTNDNVVWGFHTKQIAEINVY